MRRFTRVLAILAVLLAMPGFLATASAKYPEKPITMVIPFGAGGSHDLHARGISSIMSEILGQPMIVKLLPGSAGMKGTIFVANAKPDGYTILFTHNGIDMIVPQTRKVTIDTQKAFKTIAQINYSYNILITPANKPWKNFKEFIAYAKKNPGKINFGHSGVWGSSYTSYEMMAKATGIKTNLIPHKGGGPALRAVLAGRDDATYAQAAQAIPHLKSGKIRALAIMGDEREDNPVLKDVPSMKELGYPGVGFRMERIFMAPSGIPADRLKTLRDAFMKLKNNKSFKRFMSSIGMPIQLERGDVYDKTRPKKYAEYTELIQSLTGKK